MGREVGAVVALVADQNPTVTTCEAVKYLPKSWRLETFRTPWGSALLAGPGVLRDEERVVIGDGCDDPWGIPSRLMARERLMKGFKAYGKTTIHLAAGPFALVDLETGTITPGLNGIIPIWMASGGTTAVGNHRALIEALARASEVQRAPIGSSLSIQGEIRNIGAMPEPEDLSQMRLEELQTEIDQRITDSGWRTAGVAKGFGPVEGIDLHRGPLGLLASFSLQRLLECGSAIVRNDIGIAWWRAALSGERLFVPGFERPMLDLLAMVGVVP